MPFLHPWLFVAGAGAVSVPVLIHLLNRRRFKVVEWAAMKFLRESVRRNRRRVRLEELILLLLRCLAVFLLAVAVSRFVGCAPTRVIPLATAVQQTHVFVLDDSVSMGQKIADTTSFKKAASDLAEMVKEVPSGDHIAVLRTSRPQRPDPGFDTRDALADRDGLAGRLRSLEISDTRARLADALTAAGERFETDPTDRRLYVLSDFRRADYADSAAVETVRERLRDLHAGGAKIALLNYGAPASGNLTIEKIEVLNKLVIASLPIRVQLRVRNNGTQPVGEASVTFTVRAGGQAASRLPAMALPRLEPGQTGLVQVACELPDPGPAVVSAELPADTVAGDNTGSVAFDIRRARRVLLVDGEPDLADPARSETHFLVRAIDPRGDQAYGSQPMVVPADQLPEVDFNRYDAVILANVPDFPMTPGAGGKARYAQLEALAEYVRGGGGLAIFTGDRVDPTFYNGPFYANGAGLCPVRVDAPVRPDRLRQTYARLLRNSIAPDPVMRIFQGKLSQFTRLVRFYGYTPAKEIAPPTVAGGLGPVRILARLDNTGGQNEHSPAILARAHGRGAVMMVCTSADTEWTDWPKDPTFVVFVNDMLEELARAGGGGMTGRVGEPIVHAIAPEQVAARVLMQTPAFPAEDVVVLEGRWVGQRRRVSYDNTRHAGVYELQIRLPDETRRLLFARNVDPREGRLARSGREELAAWLGVPFDYVDKLAPDEPVAAAGATDRREYWKLALALMLIVLALEVFLGQRFGHYR